MEPKGSLPHSQAPVTCPTSWRSILILSSHVCLGLPSGLFPLGFPTKTLYTYLPYPIRATCPAHLILLGLITRTIEGGEYRSLGSYLCTFLHSPVTSSLLGPNILLSTLLSSTLSSFLAQCETASFTPIQSWKAPLQSLTLRQLKSVHNLAHLSFNP